MYNNEKAKNHLRLDKKMPPKDNDENTTENSYFETVALIGQNVINSG